MRVLVDWYPSDHARAAAVILHPHPDMGGDRHNHVVDALYRGLPEAGVATARFDFSSADPDVAGEEVAAAIEDVADRGGHGGVILAGYSFGADIAATVEGVGVLGWFLVAPPLRVVRPTSMVASSDARPKAILVAEHDQFSPPAHIRESTASWVATTVEVLPAADHFLIGQTVAVVEAAIRWVDGLLLGASGAEPR